MPLNALGHLWTIGPRLRHSVRPLACPQSRPWETTLTDPQIGPVRLTGHLREVPGAEELVVLVHGLGGSINSHYMPRGAAASERAPAERLAAIRTFREWDDRIVAPRFGFADAADYYARASVAPLLGSLRVPALLLNSELDPMVPARSVKPALAGASPRLTVRWMQGGGHVAFPGQGIDGQVIAWLRSR